MKEDQLRSVLRKLAIYPERTTAKGWMNASCPFAPWTHKNGSDKHPSFGVMVNDEGNSTYFCAGCKAKGTIKGLVNQLTRYRNMDYADVMSEVEAADDGKLSYAPFEQSFQVELPPEPLNEAMFDGLFDQIRDHPRALEFLAKRRVSIETAERLGLEFDAQAKRVTFPVRGAQGELYGFSGRSILPDADLKVKDYGGLPKRWLILGRERWAEGKPVLIVEGLFAYARMHEIGAEALFNIGALLGSNLTDEKADIITGFGHAVFLLLDPDKAGDDGTFGMFDVVLERRKVEDSAVGKLWGHVPVYVPEFPEGIEDVDDLEFDQIAEIKRSTSLFEMDKKSAKLLSHSLRGTPRR